ncbi:putative xyloglucan endotransglucosylase/hydrolase protein 26 [Bienertia sinuspersici]
MSSTGDKHDEIDFEFLGNVTVEPYTIHTNIYTQGFGLREQQFKPWFNPSDGYNYYIIFWNFYEVVWMVDNVPVRVFRKESVSRLTGPSHHSQHTYRATGLRHAIALMKAVWKDAVLKILKTSGLILSSKSLMRGRTNRCKKSETTT